MIRNLYRYLYFDNWPMLLFQRVFYRHARLLAFRRGKIEFVIDYSCDDQNGVLPCLTTDMYSRFFANFEKGRSLRILDLGANVGGFCLVLLEAGFRFEKLLCVEMNHRTYVRLLFNISQNCESKAVVLNAAVAGHSGAVRLCDTHGGTSESIYQRPAADSKTVEVPLVTFDGLVQSYFGADQNAVIDICKMDIEGAEYEVFYSPACQTIRRVKHLIIEIHSHKTTTEAELISKICSFGFEPAAKATSGEESVHLFHNAGL